MLTNQAAERIAGTDAVRTDGPLLSRTSHMLWRVQSTGLVILMLMTFFPALSHLQEYLFFTLFALALGTAYAEGRSPWFVAPLHVPIALWLGWILLSVPAAIDPAYSFAEWRKLVAKVLLFYWTVTVWQVALKDRGENLDGPLLAAVAAGSLGLSLYALPDFIQRGGTWADRPVRAQAPSSDYQWLSTYMVMAVPLLLAGVLFVRHVWGKAVYAAIACLALVAQALSYTRAGWLGLVAQGLSFGLFTRQYRVLLGLLVGFTVTVALLVALGTMGFHQDTLDPWTLNARVAVWGLMINEIAAHPLLGVGYGTRTFMDRLGDHPETLKAGGSHNYFLMVAMGSGIPALIFFIWILTASVQECLRLAQRAEDRATSALLLAVALMIVGFAVRNGFDAMFAGSLACLFWMWVAIAVAHRAVPPGHPQLSVGPKPLSF